MNIIHKILLPTFLLAMIFAMHGGMPHADNSITRNAAEHLIAGSASASPVDRKSAVCDMTNAPKDYKYPEQIVSTFAIGTAPDPACRVNPDSTVTVESTGITCPSKKEPNKRCPTASVSIETLSKGAKPKTLTRCWNKINDPYISDASGVSTFTSNMRSNLAAVILAENTNTGSVKAMYQEATTYGEVCVPDGGVQINNLSQSSAQNTSSVTSVTQNSVGDVQSGGTVGGTLQGGGAVDQAFGGSTPAGTSGGTPVPQSSSPPSTGSVVGTTGTNTGSAPSTQTTQVSGTVNNPNPTTAPAYSAGQGVSMNTTPSSAVNSNFSQAVAGDIVSPTAPQRLVHGYDDGRSIFARLVHDRISDSMKPTANTAIQDGYYVGSVQIPQTVQYVVVDTNGNPITKTVSDTSYDAVRVIAQDVAYHRTIATTTQVETFQQTLAVVGGPNAYANAGTRNESFGKIQDLIIENDAMDALRKAEAEAEKAKNSVFCEEMETSAACLSRREAYAEQVERATFIDELEERNVPSAAITHFLAVYDGVIDPAPAPETFATSTLKAMYAQDAQETAPYTEVTGATDFVLWIIDSVAQTAQNVAGAVVDTVTGWFGEGSTTEEGM